MLDKDKNGTVELNMAEVSVLVRMLVMRPTVKLESWHVYEGKTFLFSYHFGEFLFLNCTLCNKM